LLKASVTRIDTKIAKTKRIIELQKEYRTALISEVVTGKIKVTPSGVLFFICQRAFCDGLGLPKI
jgi:hypothetical protein